MNNTKPTAGSERIEAAIRSAKRQKGFALAPFLTAGYPQLDGFADLLRRTAAAADIVELGIPFTDPVADGPTIQRSSRKALESGASIPWIIDLLAATRVDTPTILMSYINPLFAYGFDRLARDCASVGVCGLIVPDMPLEESQSLHRAANDQGLCLIQMVSPVTPEARMRNICGGADGFIYATTIRGTTGARDAIDASAEEFLIRVRACSSIPILAGFGIRTIRDTRRLCRHCDGVIVGSALIEAIDNGDDPAVFLRTLRPDSIMATKRQTGIQP